MSTKKDGKEQQNTKNAQSDLSFRQKYGPWALVTGASSGIGAEFARQLAEKGLNLVLTARRKDRLEELARELSSKNNIEVKAVPADLTDSEFMQYISPVTDSLDIGLLVNNAGIGIAGGFLEHDLEDELRQLDLNCRAPLILTHVFGNKMHKRGSGGIIIVSSMAAFQGNPYNAHYGATKGYDLLLAEGLNFELKRAGVDVLALCPGPTESEMFKGVDLSKISLKLMPAKPVVCAALDSLGKKSCVIPGKMNRLLYLIGKYISKRTWNTESAAKYMTKFLSIPLD